MNNFIMQNFIKPQRRISPSNIEQCKIDKINKLNKLILGKSYKPDVEYIDGSSSILVGYYVEETNNKVEYILVSGDNKTTSYNEPKYMRNYLLKLGIDDGIIISDYAGRRTLDSVIRSSDIFQQDKITIISQKFHNQRAIFIARKNGIDAIAFNAKYPYKNNFENLNANTWTFVRELLARNLAVIDFLTNKKPTILGTNIEIKNKNILEIKRLILEK